MSRVLLAALSLGVFGSACWVGSDQVAIKVRAVPGDTDTDTDTDSEVVWDPLVLSDIEPDVGTNAGGTLVTISAGPLDPETTPEVTFGGVPAVVQSHDGDSVVVKAPAVGVEGSVDVTVSSASRTERSSGGFYYWADGAGRVGLVGRVDNYDLDRGYDIGWMFTDIPRDYDSEMHSARVRYVEPVDVEPWREWSDAFDSCRRNYVYDGPSLNILKPGVPSIELKAGVSDRYTLRVDSNDEEFVLPIDSGWIPASRGLALKQAVGAKGWFAYELDDVVTLPSTGFRVVSPAADFVEGSVGTSFALRWEGGAPGEVVLVRLNRYQYDIIDEVWSLRDIITCALDDDGNHWIDSSLFSELGPFGNLMTIRVGRALVEDSTLPTNRARVGVYGMHWWYGAAYVE